MYVWLFIVISNWLLYSLKYFVRYSLLFLLKFNRLNHAEKDAERNTKFMSCNSTLFKSKFQQQNNFWTFKWMFLGQNTIYITLIRIHLKNMTSFFFLFVIFLWAKDRSFMAVWLIMPQIAKYVAKCSKSFCPSLTKLRVVTA